MSDATYERRSDVVWRIAPDRVIVLPVEAGAGASDLTGVAAAVFAALDEPATVVEVVRRLGEAGLHVDPGDGVDGALAALVEAGLVRRLTGAAGDG